MKKELFNELLESAKEGAEIMRAKRNVDMTEDKEFSYDEVVAILLRGDAVRWHGTVLSVADALSDLDCPHLAGRLYSLVGEFYAMLEENYEED